MNSQEYWKEVPETAENIISEARDYCLENDMEQSRDELQDYINDSLLHETIDGHQWIIYYSYNLDVIKHSDNDDYYIDNFGSDSLEASLKQGGLNMLHCHIAFWAFYADVQDSINEQLEQQLAA